MLLNFMVRWDNILVNFSDLHKRSLAIVIFKRSFILFFIMLSLCPTISGLPRIDQAGISATPNPACCGDPITVNVPINIPGDESFSGSIQLSITDTIGTEIFIDHEGSLHITPPMFQTTNYPMTVFLQQSRGNCNNPGTYVITAKLFNDNGNLEDQKSTTFVLNTNCNVPNSCLGTISVNVIDSQTTAQLSGALVSLSSGVSGSTANGYFAASGQCPSTTQTISVSAQGYNPATQTAVTDASGNAQVIILLTPINRCQGIISVNVIDSQTNAQLSGALVSLSSGVSGSTANGYFAASDQCPSTTQTISVSAQGYNPATQTAVTDASGNAQVIILLTPINRCQGTISVNVIDSQTNAQLSGALVSLSSGVSGSTANGYFSASGQCPSTTQTMSVSAQGYNPATSTAVTDVSGNAQIVIQLAPTNRCQGTISGNVYDANTKSPIPGAVLLICQDGGNCWSAPPVDSVGFYSTSQQACPSTTYEITCSAEGYKSSSKTVTTTDGKGNILVDFALESKMPDCRGAISGHVFDADTKSPIPGAVLLICQDGGNCWSAAPVDSIGFFSTDQEVCASTAYEITCSAEGYKSSTLKISTNEKGSANRDISLEPECQGAISGKILDASNDQPIEDANLLICQDGKCMDPVVTDSKGQYTLKGFCPSSDFDITCSAEGYRNQETTGTTDLEGNSKNQDILMESESTLQDTRFEGTLYRGNAPMGFTVYYFKVDKVLGGQDIPIGDPVGVSVYDSSVLSGQGGSADTLQEGDKAEIYARIYADKGKHDDGYETAWSASITEEKKYYVKNIESVNKLPKLISLSPDRPSPQEPGSSITWNAIAEDQDGDPLSYRFELKRASSNEYIVVKDWSLENTWTWKTGLLDLDISNTSNSIRAKVRDSKHGDQDDQLSNEYSIKMNVLERPDYDDLRVVNYGNSYKAIFIKNREVSISVNKYSNEDEGLPGKIYQIVTLEPGITYRVAVETVVKEMPSVMKDKAVETIIVSILKELGIAITNPILDLALKLYDVAVISDKIMDELEAKSLELLVDSTSKDKTEYKIFIPAKTAEFAYNRRLQSEGQSSITGSFLEEEVLNDLREAKQVNRLNWRDPSDVNVILIDDSGEIKEPSKYEKIIDNKNNIIEFKFEPLDKGGKIKENPVRSNYKKPVHTSIFCENSDYNVFAISIKNFIENIDFSQNTDVVVVSTAKGTIVDDSDLDVYLNIAPQNKIDVNTKKLIVSNEEFEISSYLKQGKIGQVYSIRIHSDLKKSNAMEHAVEYFVSNIRSLYNS